MRITIPSSIVGCPRKAPSVRSLRLDAWAINGARLIEPAPTSGACACAICRRNPPLVHLQLRRSNMMPSFPAGLCNSTLASVFRDSPPRHHGPPPVGDWPMALTEEAARLQGDWSMKDALTKGVYCPRRGVDPVVTLCIDCPERSIPSLLGHLAGFIQMDLLGMSGIPCLTKIQRTCVSHYDAWAALLTSRTLAGNAREASDRAQRVDRPDSRAACR